MMEGEKDDGYNSADFYDCLDAEELQHTDPDDAVSEYLDSLLEPGLTREAARARMPDTITVTAHLRRVVSDVDRQHVAQWALEDALEWLDEVDNYGKGDNATRPTKGMLAAAQAFVEAPVVEYTPWQCERIAERDVDVDQWLAENPDFLADLPGAA